MAGCRFYEGAVSQGWFDWVKLSWIPFRGHFNGTTSHRFVYTEDRIERLSVPWVSSFGGWSCGVEVVSQGRLRNGDKFVTRSLIRKAVLDRYGVRAT